MSAGLVLGLIELGDDRQRGLESFQGIIETDLPGTGTDLKNRQAVNNYDIWSNIHYRYVGTKAGFTEQALIRGSHIAEGAGKTDIGDDISIRVGIQLARHHSPSELTPQHVLVAVALQANNWAGKVYPE